MKISFGARRVLVVATILIAAIIGCVFLWQNIQLRRQLEVAESLVGELRLDGAMNILKTHDLRDEYLLFHNLYGIWGWDGHHSSHIQHLRAIEVYGGEIHIPLGPLAEFLEWNLIEDANTVRLFNSSRTVVFHPGISRNTAKLEDEVFIRLQFLDYFREESTKIDILRNQSNIVLLCVRRSD